MLIIRYIEKGVTQTTQIKQIYAVYIQNANNTQ